MTEKHGRSLFYVPGLPLDDPALRFFGVLSIFPNLPDGIRFCEI